MKVFDLHCGSGHMFEGWFASEADFASQLERALVQCPWCGDANIVKLPSAPRLNLQHGVGDGPAQTKGAGQAQARGQQADGAEGLRQAQGNAGPGLQPGGMDAQQVQAARAMQAAWATWSREVAQRSEDVGEQFAEQALQMHQGELEQRPIRGRVSASQARELVQEGVPVMPLLLLNTGQGSLQ